MARIGEYRDRVKVTCNGIQGAGNSSLCATDAIYHSLKAYEIPDSSVKFSGYVTNEGGRGTRKDLLEKLVTVDQFHKYSEYACTT